MDCDLLLLVRIAPELTIRSPSSWLLYPSDAASSFEPFPASRHRGRFQPWLVCAFFASAMQSAILPGSLVPIREDWYLKTKLQG